MGKIDEKTAVPLSWLVCSVIFACGGAWATAGLVYTVMNDIRALKSDMHLVKRKLHIPDDEETASRAPNLITDAEAKATK